MPAVNVCESMVSAVIVSRSGRVSFGDAGLREPGNAERGSCSGEVSTDRPLVFPE
jgi:hypothetical protein